MSKDKQKTVTIFLARALKVTVKGQAEAVALKAGRNDDVDAEIANSPFVKAHRIDGPSDAQVAQENARIAELEAKVAELTKERDEAVAALATKQAEVDALVSAAGKPKA